MRKERRGNGKVIDLAAFRGQRVDLPPPPSPRVYGRITPDDLVEYGLADVSVTDSLRLLRAILMLGIDLLDVQAG
jgi:hypothetical protein